MSSTAEATEQYYDRTAARRWSHLTVGQLVDRRVLDVDRPAIVLEDQVRTYGELRARARRVGNALVDGGLEALERVAVLSTNRLEYMEIEAGISLARGVMVPLNWRLRKQELVNLLNRSDARWIVVESRFLPVVSEIMDAGLVPSLTRCVVLGAGEHGSALAYEDWCAASHERALDRGGLIDDPHEIIFTSGTTGDPKGAVWTNGTLIFNSLQQVVDYQLGREDSCYVQVDLYYIGGRHDFTWPLLHVGGTVHVKASGGFNASDVVDYVAANEISNVLWVPAMLFDILKLEDLASRDLTNLRMIMCGGAPVPKKFIEQAQRDMPSAAFIQVYGLTEGGGSVTFLPADRAVEKIGSAGRPGLHNEIRICDANTGEECEPGVPGEILVRGPSVTAGYWGAPAQAAATVIDGWLHTGDQGYLDTDGYLFVSGRIKDMIISGGMNIYPAEVEEVLVSLPGVEAVAVIGVPHEKWGESVRAVVQRRPGSDLTEEDVRSWCEERLASYKKPTSVTFIDDMPRTSSGKIQKYVIRSELMIQ